MTITTPRPVEQDQHPADAPLRVVELHAENFKRIRAVDITPDGDLVKVSGRNGQGKSSVLDAVWAAVANSSAAKQTPDPIRHGADTAEVRLDLGELVVTRTWTRGSDGHATTTRLKVETATGAKMRNAQTVLDTLMSRLTFDPLAFLAMREPDQVAELLRILDLPQDPADIDQARTDAFEQRTIVNRDVKRLTAQLDGIPEDPDAPLAEVTIADALADLETARQAVDAFTTMEREATALSARLTQIAVQILALEEERQQVTDQQYALMNRLDQAEPGLPDLDRIQADITDLEHRNARARAAEARRAIVAEHITQAARAELLSRDIACLDETKRTLLAEAAMPLQGLEFADDGGLTYGGVPLAQCAASERLRVAVAVAMAGNPRLRVIRVTDGSLLDTASMQALADLARTYGAQVWVEVVDETGQVGVVIEDGTVVGIETAAEVAR